MHAPDVFPATSCVNDLVLNGYIVLNLSFMLVINCGVLTLAQLATAFRLPVAVHIYVNFSKNKDCQDDLQHYFCEE